MKVFGLKRAACRLGEQKYLSQFQYAHLEYVSRIIGPPSRNGKMFEHRKIDVPGALYKLDIVVDEGRDVRLDHVSGIIRSGRGMLGN